MRMGEPGKAEERKERVSRWDDYVVIRTSDRETFKKCRRQWNFSSKIRMNYEPTTKSDALTLGTAFHAGLEVWYDPMMWGLPTTLELAVKALHDSIDEQTTGEDADPERAVEIADMHELGEGMLRNYAREVVERDRDLVPVAVEFLFLVPLTNPLNSLYAKCAGSVMAVDELCDECTQIVYMGRIDVVMVDRRHGDDAIERAIEWFKQAKAAIEERKPLPSTEGLPPVWIEDHKTTTQLGDMFFLNVDTQVGSYAWALHKLGLGVEGIIYNQVLKSFPKPPKVLKNGNVSTDKRQKTTVGMFLEALGMTMVQWKDMGTTGLAKYDEYVNYLLDNPKEFVFRLKLGRNMDEINQQGDFIIQEMLEMIDEPAIYPTPQKFTCSFCAFKAPCMAQSEGQDPQDMLDFGDYQVSTQPVDY